MSKTIVLMVINKDKFAYGKSLKSLVSYLNSDRDLIHSEIKFASIDQDELSQLDSESRPFFLTQYGDANLVLVPITETLALSYEGVFKSITQLVKSKPELLPAVICALIPSSDENEIETAAGLNEHLKSLLTQSESDYVIRGQLTKSLIRLDISNQNLEEFKNGFMDLLRFLPVINLSRFYNEGPIQPPTVVEKAAGVLIKKPANLFQNYYPEFLFSVFSAGALQYVSLSPGGLMFLSLYGAGALMLHKTRKDLPWYKTKIAYESEKYWTALQGHSLTLFGEVKTLIRNWGRFPDEIVRVSDKFTDNLSKMLFDLRKDFKSTAEQIVEQMALLRMDSTREIEFLFEQVSDALRNGGDLMDKHLTEARADLKTGLNAVRKDLKKGANRMADILEGQLDKMDGILDKQLDDFNKTVRQGVTDVGEVAKGLAKDLGDTVKGVAKDVGQAAKDISKDAGEAFKKVADASQKMADNFKVNVDFDVKHSSCCVIL